MTSSTRKEVAGSAPSATNSPPYLGWKRLVRRLCQPKQKQPGQVEEKLPSQGLAASGRKKRSPKETSRQTTRQSGWKRMTNLSGSAPTAGSWPSARRTSE
eukprot:15401552-Heterocapsa_arctica.AAC.1